MAQIATTIEQSKKLELLGIDVDTADMHYWFDANYNEFFLEPSKASNNIEKFPAWSLGALIKLLPNEIRDKRFNVVYYLTINKDSITYSNRMEDEECEYECYGDLFDCCVEMIETLKSSEYGL